MLDWSDCRVEMSFAYEIIPIVEHEEDQLDVILLGCCDRRV